MSHPTRRAFLRQSVAAGAAIATCHAINVTAPRLAHAKTPKLNATQGALTLAFADHPDLKAVGGAVKVKVSGLLDKSVKILVVRASDTRVVAFVTKCPHKGCHVRWEPDPRVFQCPCHDSAFDLEGTPQGGPAEQPLTALAATLDDDGVTVRAA